MVESRLADGLADWLSAALFALIFARHRRLHRDYHLRCVWWPWSGATAVAEARGARSSDTHSMAETEAAARATSQGRSQGRSHGRSHGRSDGRSRGGSADETAGVRPTVWALARGIISDGVMLMTVDVAVQLSLTVSIYVAARRRFETAWKLAAAQAAYWQLGPQYLVSTMYIVRVFGSQMVAAGHHRQFVHTFATGGYFTAALAVGAALIALTMRRPLAFVFGESACVYASSAPCATAYAQIFGTAADRPGSPDETSASAAPPFTFDGSVDGESDSLSHVFVAFGPTVGLQMIFVLLRAGLAVCHDFRFMALAALAALGVVFVPTIILADVYFGSSVAFYVAMYAPHFALIAVYGVRMLCHLRGLLSGNPGPWTAYMAAGGQQGLPNEGHADYAPLAAADVEQREQCEAEVMAGPRGGANESLCMPLVAHEQGGPGP